MQRIFGYTVFAICALLFFAASPAWSQATSVSTVAGLVTDEQGATVAGANVRMVDSATSQTFSSITNDQGRYAFINVNPGTYAITITKEGFSQFKIGAQKVEVGTAMTVDAVLRVGSTATTVEVVAAAGAELQTTNAAVGSTLDSQALAALPNLGRDVSALAILQPGTTPSGMVAGAFSDQNVFMLDGGNNSDDMSGNNTTYVTNFTGGGGTQTNGSPSGVVPTPSESIEEFKVSSFNQTADFSGSIGGQIQMVTKRGTNQYHGSAYGYYFATNLAGANSWVNNHSPATIGGVAYPYTPIIPNHRSRFGGSLGGTLTPKILGGKTYFFVNYEGSRFPNVQIYERSVPSDMLRAGVIQVQDTSQPGSPWVPYNLNPNPVTVNGVTYPGSTLDPRGIGLNPTIQTLWSKYMPRANEFLNQGDLYNTQGFLSTIRAPLTQNTYVARIDHDFGDRNRFMATWRYMRLTNLSTNQVDYRRRLRGRHTRTAQSSGSSRAASQLPGVRFDQHHKAHDYERYPFQLHAQFLAMVHAERSAATSRVLRCDRNRRRERRRRHEQRNQCADSVQRQQPEHAAAVLGWAGQVDERRRHVGQGQPPDSDRRRVSAQLRPARSHG
jgi:hypothetical protein